MTDTDTIVSPMTLAIISSQYLERLGLQKIFESRPTVRIVEQPHWKMPSDALSAEGRPDVFIVDMETVRDAIGAIRWIRESAPNSKIMLLSGIDEMGRTREAFEYGADGVILKIQPPTAMLAAIEALYSPPHNRAPVESHDSLGVDLKMISQRHVHPGAQPSVWPDGLTERQREIIKLVGQGLSNKDIADQLCISDSTVRHHLTGIFDKIGVPNRQKLLIHTRHFPSAPI